MTATNYVTEQARYFFSIMKLFYRKLPIFWFCVHTHRYCNCKSYLVLRLAILHWHHCLTFFFAILRAHNIVVNVTEKVINEKAELMVSLQDHSHKCQYNIVSKHGKIIPQLSFYHSSKSSDF